MARIFTTRVDRVDTRTVLCYFDDEATAREILAGQFEDAIDGFELSEWDDGLHVWRTLDQAGAVGARTIAGSRDAIVANVGLFLVFAAVLFLAAYFIPGASGTPAAGGHHDLPKSVAVGLGGGAVCVAVLRFRKLI